jgi:uncharacterized protein (DUF58 family)
MKRTDLLSIRIEAHKSKLLARHGDHNGYMRGRGMEFEELGVYTAGDPVHSINWRATARSGYPLVNHFLSAQQLNIHIVVTMNGSLIFGSPPKLDTAAQLVTALSIAALEQKDRLTVTLFERNPLWSLAPTRPSGADEAIWDAFDAVDLFGRQTDYDAMEQYLLSTTRNASLVFVVGDFLTIPKLDKIANRHSLHLLIVRDRSEEEIKLRGNKELLDPSTGESCNVSITDSAAKQYKEEMRQHDVFLEEYTHSLGIKTGFFHTDSNPILDLAAHLRISE